LGDPAGLPQRPVLDGRPAPAAGAVTDLHTLEKRHILEVLDAARGNKSEAARQLGVSRKTLERRCAAWGV